MMNARLCLLCLCLSLGQGELAGESVDFGFHVFTLQGTVDQPAITAMSPSSMPRVVRAGVPRRNAAAVQDFLGVVGQGGLGDGDVVGIQQFGGFGAVQLLGTQVQHDQVVVGAPD